jgi:hypothetical protein
VRDAVRRKVCANLLLVAVDSQTRRVRLWLMQKQSKLYGFVAAIKARKRKIFSINRILEGALDSLQCELYSVCLRHCCRVTSWLFGSDRSYLFCLAFPRFFATQKKSGLRTFVGVSVVKESQKPGKNPTI